MVDNEKIWNIIQNATVSIAEIGRKCDLTRPTMYKFRDGRGNTVNIDTLEKIANYFNMDITDLFKPDVIQRNHTNIGHHINGRGIEVSGDINCSEQTKEIEYLRKILDEKERMIQVLLAQLGGQNTDG